MSGHIAEHAALDRFWESKLLEDSAWPVIDAVLVALDLHQGPDDSPPWHLLDELRARVLAIARVALADEPLDVREHERGCALAEGQDGYDRIESKLIAQYWKTYGPPPVVDANAGPSS